MHPNEELLTRLFRYLTEHDHCGMVDCYHDEATFRDIAFTLTGKRQIHAMWKMACSVNKVGIDSDIVATVLEFSANDSTGRAVVVDDYTFRDTGRKVHNKIVSQFEFRENRIVKQTDDCDPVCWARQAFGGFQGFVAGNVGPIRRRKAMRKLKAEHPDAF